MKRLLAYLFIVLGLGLTLSVNANSAKYSYDKDFICIQDVGNGTIFIGSSKSGWATEINNIESLCSIFVYNEFHCLMYLYGEVSFVKNFIVSCICMDFFVMHSTL